MPSTCTNESRPYVLATCSRIGGRFCAQEFAARTSTPQSRRPIMVKRRAFFIGFAPSVNLTDVFLEDGKNFRTREDDGTVTSPPPAIQTLGRLAHIIQHGPHSW